MKHTSKLKNGRKKISGIAYWLFYAIYLGIFLVGVTYCFHVRYITKIKNIKRPASMEYPVLRHVDPQTMRRLGHISHKKKNCFINFDAAKKNGGVRIGCFGDSFTHGDEVEDGFDYPAQLQYLFESNGYTNIEVINFGNAWHGFHQTHMLWEAVGQKFDLDFVLLGPMGFWADRDTTFNHSWEPYYIHSRYILVNGAVKTTDIYGDTYLDTFKNYNRFIPHRVVTRYDIRPPAFIRCLLPIGRTLPNPFYYMRGRAPEDEAHATYKILLREMAKKSRLIVGVYPEDIAALAGGIDEPSLLSARFMPVRNFPYVAPGGHNAPLGNRIVAQQFFDALIGRDSSHLNLIQTAALEDIALPDSSTTMAPLHEYTNIALELNDAVIGTFVEGVGAIAKRINCTGLLGIKNTTAGILDPVFFQLPFELNPNMELAIAVNTTSGTTRIPLGAVRPLAPGINIGYVESSELKGHDWLDMLILETKNLRAAVPPNAEIESVQLLVNGNALTKETAGSVDTQTISLQPLNGSLLRLRGAGNVMPDIPAGIKSGYIELRMDNNAGTTRLPVARWQLQQHRHTFENGPAAEHIARGPDGPGYITDGPKNQ